MLILFVSAWLLTGHRGDPFGTPDLLVPSFRGSLMMDVERKMWEMAATAATTLMLLQECVSVLDPSSPQDAERVKGSKSPTPEMFSPDIAWFPCCVPQNKAGGSCLVKDSGNTLCCRGRW